MHGQTCIFWANLTPFSLVGAPPPPAAHQGFVGGGLRACPAGGRTALDYARATGALKSDDA